MAYINLPDSTTLLNVNHIPDSCPFCHSEINPQYISSHFQQYEGIKEYAILCSCPIPGCSKVFIANYMWDSYSNSWELSGITHENTDEIQPPPAVSGISKNFTVIYNQSLKAEQAELMELSWLGYRKSLEVLVKDFLSEKYPADQNRIKTLSLSDCINDYIPDERIKEIARRTNSLENDLFSHFPGLEESNPEEIKKLIQIILRWIEIDASEEIPAKEISD